MDRELLIEIGVEELPAAWLPALTQQFGERVEARLKDARIAPGAPVEVYGTPRRLTARLGKIAERQEDLEETVTGPPVSAAFGPDGQPTPAAIGFARKQGVGVEELGRTKTAKGEYLSYLKRQRGKSAIDALPDVLGAVLRDLTFPKQMKWDATLDDGRGEFVFGRPIRWLLFLYGGRVVPFTIGRAANAAGSLVQDVESGALTYGHRFLATSGRAGRSIKVRSFDEYQARLKEHFIVLDHAERRDRIGRDLEGHARRLNGRVGLKEHQRLLDEVADLVEFPGVVAGFYDAAFLALPHEVLTTTLVHHQHYFPVMSDRGELKEAFLAVVNTQPKDERLIAKNAERVVTARLRDARFFWETDRKTPLGSRLDRLHTVLFHKKLGSYRDKAARIKSLAEWIAGEALGAPAAVEHSGTAAWLSKTDLTTDMVFEFPELQGTMGGIYAREEGLPEEVWKAIYFHYLPVGVEADAPPSRGQLGVAGISWAAVSLADKLDTLLGLISAGEKASGSRDPFGMRRAAQGLIRILVDLEALTGLSARPTLGPMVQQAMQLLKFSWADQQAEKQFWVFMADRLRHLMQVRGLQHEEIAAVTSQVDRVADRSMRTLMDYATEIAAVRATADFGALAEAFKRANNIVEEAWGSDAAKRPLGAHATRLHEPAEVALRASLTRIGAEMRSRLDALDAKAALLAVVPIRQELDRFFAEVRVNVDDAELREARLALLAELRSLMLEIGDLSYIAPKRPE